MADGGDGTVEAFLDSGARARRVTVRGPLGAPVEATFALDGAIAIVESAAASGLVLLDGAARDATRASSYGTGELLRAALDAGAQRVVIGIGGSASNDGGAGLLEALGARLSAGNGGALAPGGAALAQLATLDLSALDPRLRTVRIEVASDVDNPLTGPSGASAVFGPQKGATPAQVAELDRALGHFADLVARATGRDLRETPGAGAAGGMGFALVAVLGATIRSGAALVAELRGLGPALGGAALCLTGEGRIDAQTLHGKTVDGVAKIARSAGVPVIAFGGSVDPAAEGPLAQRGVVCMPVVPGPMPLESAMSQAVPLARAAAARVARCWQAASAASDRPA